MHGSRLTIFAALLCLVVLAPNSAAATSVAFHSPGQFGGDAELSGAQWALVVVRRDQSLSAEANLPGGASLTNRTWTSDASFSNVLTKPVEYPRETADAWQLNQTRLAIEANPVEVSSVYLEADSLALTIAGVEARLTTMPRGQCATSLVSLAEQQERFINAGCYDFDGVGLRLEGKPALQFTVEAVGVRKLHLHDTEVSCTGEVRCPFGGVRYERKTDLGTLGNLSQRAFGFDEIHPDRGASANITGTSAMILLGGRSLDAGIDGWMRLPLASGAAPCPSCSVPDDQTFYATGALRLEDVAMGENGGLNAVVSGDFTSARFDETVIDPALLGGTVAATAAVAAAVLVLAKPLLGPLFTRHSDDDLLANKRRRALYEFVVKNPGVHFRAALRGVGIPAGAAQHHIAKLVRAGLLTERRHGSKVFLFQDTGPLRANWQDFVALRDPNLHLLHDWIGRHPDRPQQDLIAAFRQSHGWTRSATQGRLERLVRDGVVHAKKRGRYKHYSAAKQAPAMEPATMPVPATATA